MKLKLSMALIVTIFGLVILIPTALALEPEDAMLSWGDSIKTDANTCEKQAENMKTMQLTLQNNTDKDIWVSQVRWCKVGGFGLTDSSDWSSTGWWKIRPNDERRIYALAKTGSFYIHAQHGRPSQTATLTWPSSDWEGGYTFTAWVAPWSPQDDIFMKTGEAEAKKQGYHKVYFMKIGTDINYRNSCNLDYWNSSTKTGWRINCRIDDYE